MPSWKRYLYHLDRIEQYVVVVLYSYFTFIVVFEVVRRYVFHSSSEWGEETARYAFVYMSFIGAAEAIKSRSHLKIDMFQRLMSQRQLFLSYLLTDVCFIVLAALVVRFSLNVIRLQVETGTMMQGLDWNLAFAHAALPIGWSLIIIRLIQRLVGTIRKYAADQPVAQPSPGMMEEEG